MPSLSIIMPVLDEAAGISAALEALTPFRRRGVEVIVVDGGSRDRTVELARPLADRTIVAPRGRGAQMNAGAAIATGDVLLFLHADTTLPPDADGLLLEAMRDSTWQWGRFDARIEGRNPLLAMVAGFMNWRSLITGIATGDQAMFARRAAFDRAGGFPDIPLMEDVAMSKRLKRLSDKRAHARFQRAMPLGLSARVVTSGRRYDERGVIRMILLMWRLRLEFFLGADPVALARRYGYVPRDD